LAVYRRGARPRFLLVLLILTSITLVTLDVRGSGGGTAASLRGAARDVFSPVQSATDAVVSPVTDFFHGVFDYRTLRHENSLLRQQLAQRNTDQVAAIDAARERQDLLDLLNLPFVGDVPSVAARVTAGPESNFQVSVVVDRGSDDGVLMGMPVVAGSGLVGRVQQVARHESTVQLLTDPGFSVGVRLSPSGDLAVATGQGPRSPLVVSLVDPAMQLAPGSVVATSGLRESPYPPDIPIGKIRSAGAKPGALQKDVVVDPVADLSRLTFVRILLWTPR